MTHDELYLAEQLGRVWGQELSPAALQKLNTAHGTAAVSSALRSLHGFPPEEAVRSLYAYVQQVAADSPEAVSA